jgi:TrwC relaxase/AAA domain
MRNMAEHLLQQTLPPEMAVMADYYEQGVTPPTAAEAAAGRYAHLTVGGRLSTGDTLDILVATEANRLAESVLGADGRRVQPVELHLRAAASLAGAGLITVDEAAESLNRLNGEVDLIELERAVTASTSGLDFSSATATPRRDMNPALATRLGIDTNRGLTTDEIAFLLNGQRADGKNIEGKAIQAATLPLSTLFDLDPAIRPSRVQLERILAGETTYGEPLPAKDVERAVGRFTAAMGVQTKGLSDEQRENILSGRMADGSELTDRAYQAAMNTSKSRIGYIDLTFSAPKSFSVAWAFAPTTAERAILHRAHTEAIETVLKVVESEIGQARIGKGGKGGTEPGSVGWVTFDHYAARPTVEVVVKDDQGQPVTELHTLTGTGGRVPGDMQVHTHAAIFNVVETQSGRVGGLHLAQLEGKIHEWGALYQAYLASNLRKHGVDVALDSQNEMARLTSVPQNVTAHYSKRTMNGTDAARAYATSQGLDWDSLDPARKVGLLKAGVQNPREAKTDDVSDLAAWTEMAKGIGYTHRSVLRPDDVQPVPERAERLETAYQTALHLLEKQFERRAVIGSSDARVVATKGLIAAGVESPNDISEITRAFRERGIRRRGEDATLIWGNVAGKQGKEKVVITTSLEEHEEKTLIATAKAAAKDKSASLSMEQIEKAIGAFPNINFKSEHGQAQRAVIDKLGQGGRVGLAIGVAGSGKSTLLKPLVHAWNEEGRVVHGIALAWRQADDLADAGINKPNIRAVDSFLRGLERNSLKLTRESVVVVDEVGLLGTRQLNDILRAQKKTGFQLVMIGDPKQMQAVDAGPVIDLLRRALGTENVPELGTSVRQKEAEEQDTVLMFRNGNTAEALDRKAANGTLRIAPGGYREAISTVVDLWQQRREENRDRGEFTITVSAPTNAEAHDISMLIRECRRTMGEIGEDKIIVRATDREDRRSYDMALAKGDRVRLFDRTNAKFTKTGTVGNIGRNGNVLEISEVRDDGLVMRNSEGREGLVSWATLTDAAGKVQLAYGDALTTNTAQGSTVTEHIHAMPSGTRLVSAFGAYTSGSRHREQSFIVTSEGAERSEVAGRRPLGDLREILHKDVLDNIKRNLARQPEKESAIEMLERAEDLRRGTIQTVQKSLHNMETRAAGGQTKTTLQDRFAERRINREIEKRLPTVTERLMEQVVSLKKATRSAGTVIAEQIAEVIRRHVKKKNQNPQNHKTVGDGVAHSTKTKAPKQPGSSKKRKGPSM